jgi:autotransporter-associated beta strand protein
MKSPRHSLPHPLLSSALLAAVLALPCALNAVTYTWDGGDGANGSWGAAANWVGNPTLSFVNTTDLVFNDLTRATTNAYFGGTTRLVRSITFGSNIDSTWTTATSTGSILTFSSDTGVAALNVNAGATADISFAGGVAGVTTGFQRLNSNLEINHNGSGLLLWNRQTDGTGGITKNGSGTMSISAPNANSFTGAVNVNAGRLIMGSTSGFTGDLNTASGIALGGGILEIRTSTATNKEINPNLTVSSASTFAYNNTAATDQSLTVGTGSMVLNANLTVQNISSSVAGNNIVNISRNLTGSGDLIVDTYKDVASGAVAFSNGRVQLSGDNTAWTGNLVVAKGTSQFSGPNSFVPAAGSITLGTTGNSFGAGLGFNQAGADVTVSNAITVTTGGVRLIRNNSGPGSSNEIALDGAVTLNGDLTLDHAGLGATESISVNGNVTGSGSLNVTFVGPHPVAGSAVRFNGHKAYTGATNIGSGASLILGASSSLASSAIDVGAGATFDVSASPFTLSSGRSIGGTGTVDGAFTFGAGSNLIFNTSAALNMTGAVSFGGFGVTNLVGLNSSTIAATYTVLNGSGSNIDFTNLANVGPAQAVSLGGGLAAYFDTANGDLAVTVSAIPEPGAFALVGGLSVLGAVATRRRRRA